jgi:hypothetical protein
VTLLWCLGAVAEAEPTTPGAQNPGTEPLPLQVADPTAYLLQLQFQYELFPSYWTTRGSQQEFTLKPIIPFRLLGRQNVLRLTLPYDITTPQNTRGNAAMQTVGLMLFDYWWGRWVVGISTNSEPLSSSHQNFQIGPAAGIVTRFGRWLSGVLLQNFLGPNSYKIWLQPVFAARLAPWLGVSLGDIQIEYDWSLRRFTQVPVGLQLDVTPKLFGIPLHFYVNGLYNPEVFSGSYIWRVVVGVAPLVPHG